MMMEVKSLGNYSIRHFNRCNFFIWFGILFLFSCQKSTEEFREYFDNGVLKTEGTYVNEFREGNWYIYDSDGDTTFIDSYIRDALVNQIVFSDNVRFRSAQYKDDKLHGAFMRYYDSGEIECHGEFREGELVGMEVCLFIDGGIKRTVDHGEGDGAGEFIQYYPNGNIQVYVKKMGEGVYEHFDSLGNLGWRIIHKNYEPFDTLEFNFSTF